MPAAQLACLLQDTAAGVSAAAGGMEGVDEPVGGLRASASLDLMSASGQAEAKGGLTVAGREYQKHMGEGEIPVVRGAEFNAAGQNLLDDILTSPGTAWKPISAGAFKGGTYVIMPNGTGAAFGADLQFRYFGQFRYPGILP